MSAIGVIGGTGVYDPSIFENIHEESLMTPYGEIDYVKGTYKGKTVIFVARHGKDHTIPPHKINYRANIWGLKKLGVKFIISTTAVGSLNKNFEPGHFVLTDQFLDFTKNRVTTFYEGGERPVAHLDVTNPQSLQTYLIFFFSAIYIICSFFYITYNYFRYKLLKITLI